MKLHTAVGQPGFRLEKLEVFNWGAFDSTGGDVYSFRPAGESALLIGKNGSGKSTLVDALLTLLVRPVVRNYNVAAGAKKQERDEKSYLRGAYGRTSREEDNQPQVQFLRPGNGHYAVLLAVFKNEGIDQAFTIAQVLYLNADGRAEKVYCFADEERSIAGDLSGMKTTEKLRQQLQLRGFHATSRYTDYARRFAKATGARPKAMDMFNQTVAVKDIQSLTEFIRAHMLEAKPWSEKVESLLNHFTLLSDAHQTLLKARRQLDLLEPIESDGKEYQDRADQLARTSRVVDAADSFFRQKTIELFEPKCADWRDQLASIRSQKHGLTTELEKNEQQRRQFQNEIDQAGGIRLRQIPLLIENLDTAAAAAREAHQRFEGALERAQIRKPSQDAEGLASLLESLPPRLAAIGKNIEEVHRQRDALVIERGEVASLIEQHEQESKALQLRHGNLPEYLVDLRRQLADALEIDEIELPFAAELIQLPVEDQAWEASVELVLRNFALSLLAPQKHYQAVCQYLENHSLVDRRGRGRRLTYLKVCEQTSQTNPSALAPHSLLRKIELRDDHPLSAWVADQLRRRFDYLCCETVDEFKEARRLAMTKSRHVKMSEVRHEKDDRPRAVDPHNYVLGWDNREKRRRLTEQIERLTSDRCALDDQIKQLDATLSQLRDQQTAIAELQQFRDFAAIDYARHNREIHALELERQQFEDQSQAIQSLKGRLAELNNQRDAIHRQRDDAVGRERELLNDIANGERLAATANRILSERAESGELELHQASFADLEASLAQDPLTADNVLVREGPFMQDRRKRLDRLHNEVAPLEREVCSKMNRFLREFPEQRDDLDARIEYLGSFLDLLHQVRAEDLPRHESRFKSRLNDKVTQEIGLLHGALQSERSEIEEKIALLNASLRQVEYRAGTHMRLEAQPVRDREVSEFRESVASCLTDMFEGSLSADEARYVRIEKLIARLREDKRWRDKVTDVRRWFDFAAREIDDQTGEERGYYADSTGQSGGEKAKLAFTILVAAIAYQYDIDPQQSTSNRFHFVVVDEMFSKVDDQYAQYALELFGKFGLQLLIVAPLDAKALVTEPFVGCYLQVVKNERTHRSEVISITAHEFEETMMLAGATTNGSARRRRASAPK